MIHGLGHRLPIGLVVATGLAALIGLAITEAQVRPPSDFVMEKGEGSPGPVTFSHERHLARVAKCTTCHARTFKLKRGQSAPITMEALQQGKFCGACHDGTRQIGGVVVFAADACDRCHAP